MCQLGDGTKTARLYVPTLVTALPSSYSVASVSAGDTTTCVTTNDGAVLCWGFNGYGLFGDGTVASNCEAVLMDGFEGTPLPVPAPTPRPTPEPTPTAVSYSLNSVSAGYFATFVLNDYGGIWATGYSGVNGQLGDSPSSTATTYSITTVQRVDGSIENIALMRQSKGYQSKSTCVIAVSTSGTIVFWPALTMSLSGVTGATYGIEELTGFSSSVVNAAVAGMDSGHSICAIIDTGAVECVGYNGYGQLGDGTATNQAAPVAVTGLPSNFKATQLALGKQHGCTSNTTNAFCWGYNYYGNVGCGDNCARGIIGSAVSVVGSGSYGSDVSDLQCGYYHCCMRFTSGNVSCWGSNDYGQLGDGTNTARGAPFTVIGGLGGGAVSMSLATYSTCALMADGSIYCWVRGGLWEGCACGGLVPSGSHFARFLFVD